jgi:hypothetical protein
MVDDGAGVYYPTKWSEGKVQSALGVGNNDDSLTLAKGSAKQVIDEVQVSVPGAIGDIYVIFYDGLVATNVPITGAMYVAAGQPFIINKRVLSGILGWRIAGRTAGGTKAYINTKYTYAR